MKVIIFCALALMSTCADAQNFGRYCTNWSSFGSTSNNYNYQNYSPTQWYNPNAENNTYSNNYNSYGYNNYSYQNGDLKINLRNFGINLLRNGIYQLINVLAPSNYVGYDNIQYLDNSYNVTFFDQYNQRHVRNYPF